MRTWFVTGASRGFGALIAVIMFAYLVFALICAEEF
jgi:K+-transporting ATPase KdpF subunit